MSHSTPSPVGATLVVALSSSYRLKIEKVSRMSQLADRVLTALTAIGGSAAFLEILRRWLQRRQEKRQEQLQFDVRLLEEGHALLQEAYQHEREALQALAEERECRHKAELQALEVQMQAKLEALTKTNESLVQRLGQGGTSLLGWTPSPQPEEGGTINKSMRQYFAPAPFGHKESAEY